MIGKEQSSLETKIECTKCQGLGIYNKVQLKREVRYEKTRNVSNKPHMYTTVVHQAYSIALFNVINLLTDLFTDF